MPRPARHTREFEDEFTDRVRRIAGALDGHVAQIRASWPRAVIVLPDAPPVMITDTEPPTNVGPHYGDLIEHKHRHRDPTLKIGVSLFTRSASSIAADIRRRLLWRWEMYHDELVRRRDLRESARRQQDEHARRLSEAIGRPVERPREDADPRVRLHTGRDGASITLRVQANGEVRIDRGTAPIGAVEALVTAARIHAGR